ncbi:MAG TPA: hypothetical protein VHO70_00590 [Chitinispirillaceae bacterium]|nr:hypothetical protein [Chitinispirillaceae bacterium]
MNDGLIGLLLYLAHWLSPGTGVSEIDIDFLKKVENHSAVFQCRLESVDNRQLEQLIDAGIPLRFKFVNTVSEQDTVRFFRTLQFDIIDFTYTWTDSLKGKSTSSGKYSLIHLAMRDFCKWKLTIPEASQSCRVEVTILPSRAEQLNKVVDMSKIWGQQKLVRTFNPSAEISRRNQSKTK